MDKQKIESYHTVIIGGGVVGAGVFRELGLRQEKALLLEKGDFSSQTSQSSSKMLHGGIRYLENFHFSLVREALREKNLWSRLAPRLVKEEMFYIPVYKESKWPLFFVRIGLFLYDLLSGFKNPRRAVLNSRETMKALPGLKEQNLRGCGVYSDAVVEDAKLALECVYDGLALGGQALNYHEVVKLEKKDDGYLVSAKDLESNEVKVFQCEHVSVCAGPFTDQLLKRLEVPWEPKMILSKGSHLWLESEALAIERPMVLQTSDNRVIFVIPQRGAILVGTTEKALRPDADIFNIQPDQEEIDYLLAAINQYFPQAQIGPERIISTFAGVRPLVAEKGKERGKVSRHHKIYSPMPKMHVVIGGKFTTFRVMAEDVVERIFRESKRPFKRGLSKRPLSRPSVVGMTPPKDLSQLSKKDLQEIACNELPKTMEDMARRRLSLLKAQDGEVLGPAIQEALEQAAASREKSF